MTDPHSLRPTTRAPLRISFQSRLESTTMVRHLDHCTIYHECSAHFTSQLPHRIIDLGPINAGPRPWIRIKETAPGELGRYAAVSHCWGDSSNVLKLTSESLPHFANGLPWDHLSPLYQDVISISMQLHIRYIWIDSLCIVQDDLTDRHREA